MIFFKKVFSSLFLLGLPGLSLAQGYEGLAEGDVSGLLQLIFAWLNNIFYALMGVAFIIFVWGIIKFIFSGGDAGKVGESKKIIVFGLIGLFVMVSVFGLVYLVGQFIGIRPGGTIEIPSSGYLQFDENGKITAVNSDQSFLSKCSDLRKNPLGGLQNIACFIGFYLSFIPPILFALAMIYFMFGIIRFIKSGNTEEKDSAKTAIVYGILAIFVIVGVWGLVWLLKSVLVI